MFIQTGCISGWQSIDVPVTTCEMQGIALTLRNSTVSSIKHDTPKSRKDAQLSSSGDAARSSDTYSTNSITQLLLAASVNAYDNGPVLTSQYQVPIAFTNWANRGSVSGIGLRLGVATNETPNITVPNQVDFQQNFNGEDSLTMITRYYSASGNITVVGSGTKVLAEDVSQLTIPLHGSTAEGDTVILVVMSELDLAIPSGFNWDYTDKIKGILPNLNELQRNTQLSVFRKVVTLEDLNEGDFTVSVYGVPVTEPPLTLEPETDPLFEDVLLLSNYDQNIGSSDPADITDFSTFNRTANPSSTFTLTSSSPKFGAGALGLNNQKVSYNFTILSLDTFTVEGWFKLDAIGAYEGIFYCGNPSDNDNRVQLTIRPDASISLYLQAGAGTGQSFTSAAGYFSAGVWYYFRATKNGDDVALQIDDTLIDSGTYITPLSGSPDFYLGVSRAGGTEYNMTGQLDEIRVTGALREGSAPTEPFPQSGPDVISVFVGGVE